MFLKDDCDCVRLKLVEVWVGGSDGGSVWVVSGVMP